MIREANIKDFDLINKKLLKDEEYKISEQEYSNHPFSKTVLFIDNVNIIGLLSYYLIYDKIEIQYIYVDVEHRNKHIGMSLLSYLIEKANENKIINISLEVKKSNVPAINLYKKFSFKEAAIRQKYYGDEDGILMIREMIK